MQLNGQFALCPATMECPAVYNRENNFIIKNTIILNIIYNMINHRGTEVFMCIILVLLKRSDGLSWLYKVYNKILVTSGGCQLIINFPFLITRD